MPLIFAAFGPIRIEFFMPATRLRGAARADPELTKGVISQTFTNFGAVSAISRPFRDRA
jgi:hypothetical protein